MRVGATYLVGIVNGHAVACGAVVTLDPDTAEIKRMYVRPAFRGQGYSRAILAELEELATRAGYQILRLETGGYLPVAMSLYRTAGYQPINAYGEYVGNAHSVCFEKRLPVLA